MSQLFMLSFISSVSPNLLIKAYKMNPCFSCFQWYSTYLLFSLSTHVSTKHLHILFSLMTTAASLDISPQLINLKHLPTLKIAKPSLKISFPPLSKSFNMMPLLNLSRCICSSPHLPCIFYHISYFHTPQQNGVTKWSRLAQNPSHHWNNVNSYSPCFAS